MKLEPCPFCGDDSSLCCEPISAVGTIGGDFHRWVAVVCFACDARGPELRSKKQAIAAWNERRKADNET